MKKYSLVFITDLPKRFRSVVEDIAAVSVGDTPINLDDGCIELYLSVKNDSLKEISTHPGQEQIIKEHKREIAKAKELNNFMKANKIDFIDPNIDTES